jgi:hypothetical protein
MPVEPGWREQDMSYDRAALFRDQRHQWLRLPPKGIHQRGFGAGPEGSAVHGAHTIDITIFFGANLHTSQPYC